MSFFSKVLNLVPELISGIVDTGQDAGAHLSNWFKSKSGSGLTEAQKQQNAFEAQQAEVSYERQKEYYQQFQSPAAMMQQYRDAGLNGAVMMSGGSTGAVAAPQVPQATGTSAGSQTASLGDIAKLVSDMSMLGVNKELVRSQANKNNAEAAESRSRKTGQDITNQFLPDQFGANIDNLRNNASLALERINTEQSQQALNLAGVNLEDARTALTLQQAYAASIDNETRAQLNALDIKLKENDTKLQECDMRYKSAMTAHAWADIKRINAERDNIVAERNKIIAETDDVNAAAYGKWLDNKIKDGTAQGLIEATNFKNDPERLRYDWDWQHTSNIGRTAVDVLDLEKGSRYEFGTSLKRWSTFPQRFGQRSAGRTHSRH